MSYRPPRAPTFPKFEPVDSVIRNIDDPEDLQTPLEQPPSAISFRTTNLDPSTISSASNLLPSNPLIHTSAPAMSSAVTPPTGAGFPSALNGPSATTANTTTTTTRGRVYRSRLAAIFTWKDPKASVLALGIALVFFYMTMWKQYSILSVVGATLGIYLSLGLVVVNVNHVTGNSLDKFIKRPQTFAPVFQKDSARRLADTFVEEGNEIAEQARHILYCDNPQLTISWIFVALFLYIIGRSFSLLPVMFIFTMGLFTVPIAYEKNKKQVDDILDHLHGLASKHVETGRKAAGQHANKIYDMAAEKSAPYIEKSPALKGIADRVGFTPSRTKKSM